MGLVESDTVRQSARLVVQHASDVFIRKDKLPEVAQKVSQN